MSTAKKKLHIIDGFNILFRAFYAVPSLTRSDDMPVGALYGFLSSITKIMELEEPEHLLVALDSPGPGVRHELYKEYKSHRGEAPQEFIVQAQHVGALMDTLGIKHTMMRSFEADDVIAAYTKHALKEQYKVVIVSSDKDLAQLVQEDVELLNPGTFVRSDVFGVKEKFGVAPSDMLEYLIMVGDSSDNIPGVRGVGPKTALKLLDCYEDIDGIYAHIDELKPAVKKAFEDFAPFRETSYELVRLRDDIPVQISLNDLLWAGISDKKVDEVVRTYEFFSLKGRLVFLQKHTEVSQEHSEEPLDLKNLAEFLRDIDLYGYVHCIKTDVGYLCSSGREKVFAMEHIPEELKSVFMRRDVRGVFWDVRECVDVVDPGHHDDAHVLSFLAYGVLNMEALWKHDAFRFVVQGKNKEHYVSSLCMHLSRVVDICMHTLHKQALISWYKEVEMPLLNVLGGMERYGMAISMDVLQKSERLCREALSKEEQSIFAYAGKTFNVASSQQLSVILYDELKILPQSRVRSTDAKVLEEFKHEPLVKSVMRWRMFHKLLTTYATPLQKKGAQGVIHTHFTSVETLSGRLSSFDPNVQNIPVRTQEGALIRSAFIARPGHKLIVCDYSQIELRLLAHYAGAGKLREAFFQGKDIHQATASLVFNVPEGRVTKEQRGQAKVVNFGLVYGMGAAALAQRLSLTRPEAQALLERCLGRYPEIDSYTKKMQEQAQQKGYVTTIFQRPCYLPLITSINMHEKNHALRQAINIPLQASNADIMKRLMVQLAPELKKFNNTHIVLQVHDEIVVEAPEPMALDVQKCVCALMERVVSLDVQLVVDTRIAAAWSDSAF